MIIYLSLLVCLIGVVMYAISSNPKMVEIGRLMFFAGLLAFLIRLTPQAIDLLR